MIIKTKPNEERMEAETLYKEQESPYLEESRILLKQLQTFCFCNLIFSLEFSSIFSIYPTFAITVGLDYFMIGVVFAANPIGSLIIALFIGPKISVWGRKRCLVFSQILSGFSFFLFALLPLLSDSSMIFCTLSVLTRLIQGMSRGMYVTTAYAYVSIIWKDSIQRKLSLLETINGTGLFFGSIVGALISSIFGFSSPFILLGMLSLTGAGISYFNVLSDDQLPIVVRREKQVSITMALKIPKILCSLIAIQIVAGGTYYYSSIYVTHMKSFGISQQISSIFQSSQTIGYILGLQLVTRLPKSFERPFIISIGLIFSLIGNMLMAPFWNRQSNSAPLFIIGQLIGGSLQGFTYIPSIPQMTSILRGVYDDPEMQTKLSDISSGLLVFGLSSGISSSQVLGGKLYDFYGGSTVITIRDEREAFYRTCMMVVTIIFQALIIFIIYGDGLDGWMKTINNLKSSDGNPPENNQLLELQNYEQKSQVK